MGKTYRRLPTCCCRSPRGRSRAIIQQARKGAIPPDPYDDIMTGDEANRPWGVARQMKADGFTTEQIISTLRNKFKLKRWEIKRIL